jgi:hypothetical protein
VLPLALAAGVVVGLVCAMAFFVRGFDHTGDGPRSAAPASTPRAAPAASATPARPRIPAATPTAGRYVVAAGGPTITLGAGGGGLHIVDNRHRLVARVWSAAPVYAVGWLIPTSLDHSYGKDMHPGRSFTIDTRVSGRPKYALLWIYAGASGAPVTCTISIDGVVRSEQTTSGPYGRQVCYA